MALISTIGQILTRKIEREDALAIALQVIAIRHQEFTRILISLTLHKSWGKMIIIERKMRMSQAIVIAQQLREGLLTIGGTKDIITPFIFQNP